MLNLFQHPEKEIAEQVRNDVYQRTASLSSRHLFKKSTVLKTLFTLRKIKRMHGRTTLIKSESAKNRSQAA